jgi:2-keto-4-pentenoate hydratase/2-oxohepta-3-ene-1,7-dioic acid hydratase in catechol pathway
MRLCTYLRDGEPRLAVVDRDAAIDLNHAQPRVPWDLRRALRSGVDLVAASAAAISSKEPRLPLTELRYAPLLPEPGKIVCLGLNYYDHAAEAGRDKPNYPWFFLRAASSLIAHQQPALVPKISSKLDYEAELAVVIGRRVPRRVPRTAALHYVFGYSCFNDLSVRDYQKRTPQWTIGKNFDATGAFGPVLASADHLPLGAAELRIQSRMNGRVMQDANTRDMIFGVADTIALLAACMTLEPGDVISMGTPGGVGQSRTPPLWLKAGDTIEVEIEGIGSLQNPIADEAA